MNVVEIDHPLIEHKLTILRDKKTSTELFRSSLEQLTSVMIPYILNDLSLKDIKIITPLCETIGKKLNQKYVLVPILRAGLGMVNSFVTILPEITIGHIGVQRNPDSLKAEPYYLKLPKIDADTIVIVCDPMLATGVSAVHAISSLMEKGVSKIKFVSILSSPTGIKTLSSKFPTIQIYTAKIDERLDENAYIVPGLGDAGDRIFGTEH